MTVVLWILLALLALIVFVLAVPFGAHVAYIGGELAVDARVMGINIGIIPQKERKKPKKEKKTREKVFHCGKLRFCGKLNFDSFYGWHKDAVFPSRLPEAFPQS